MSAALSRSKRCLHLGVVGVEDTKLADCGKNAALPYKPGPRLVASALPAIRKWLLNQGIQLHKRARIYLSRFDRDLNPSPDKGGARVVVGAFSWTSKE
ncbi:MAG: hypothetical protein DCC75_00075 [Proteobacteria bacterium]|nr:MAG: hypothetical protein DCC75_00075 [Pseudomonadota bacterium]